MIFGGNKKRIEELELENANLKKWVEYFKGLDAVQLSQVGAKSRAEVDALTQHIAVARAELAAAQSRIVETDEIALLQEVGIYRYRHPLDTAVAYQERLKTTKEAITSLAKSGAVDAAQGWTVNNSRTEGAKMTRDLSKLMLRAYNAEADNLVRALRPHSLPSAIARLEKARATIAKLGSIVQMRITDEYQRWRVYELELTADYLVKVEEEKERLREERARQREEEKAIRELEAERRRLEKEQSHYEIALEKLRAKGDEAAIAELEAKLLEIKSAITGIENREANIRAGYVYVISNFGSFGQHIVKIGMTRRLEPMDRVRELGDASVPFRFDVHALVFSHDAVGLESKLHAHFNDRRVNLVNYRREYFYVTPIEVRDALERIGTKHLLEFELVPEAAEWRQSGGDRRASDLRVTGTDNSGAQ
jgi:Meiotically Up-regulated Gene 113 (MUG113) protein/uncharacterized protein DUF4041